MTLRGLILDLDGTLADTLPLCISVFRTIFRERGHDLDDDAIRAEFGPTEEGILRAVLGDPVEPAMQRFLHEYQRRHDECAAPFDGLTELLRGARRRGVRLGLVTGKGPRTTPITLRALGVDDLFETIGTGSEAGPVKPACIARVLEEWRLDAEHVAYVGDHPYDVEAAHEAGVLAVAAAWAESCDVDALAARQPDQLFRSVADFAAWLERASGP